jgi:hypothetical protein
LKDFIEYRVTSGDVDKIECPDGKCLKRISDKLVTNHLMSEETVKKYQRFLKRNEVSRNPSLKFCPSPDCEGVLKKPLVLPGNETCTLCEKTYCFQCLRPPHEAATCEANFEKEY